MKIRDEDAFRKLDVYFRKLVERLETICGFELDISSSYREADKRCHGRGKAVDIACQDSAQRMSIVRGLLYLGVRRIGIYNRHVHADTCTDSAPRDVMWWGESS